MDAIELIQSMRVGTFGDFVVLGSQYKDEAGDRHWYIALLTGPEPVANKHTLQYPLHFCANKKGLPGERQACFDSC
jgi:hypothetical protein